METSSNIEPELNSLLTKLDAEIQADRREVEAREKRITKNEELLRAVRASLAALHPERRTNGYGSKVETVKGAISGIASSRFTQSDVEAGIRKLNPEMDINRNRIRSILWNLASGKQLIRQVVKGNNQQPSIYEKLNMEPVDPAAQNTHESSKDDDFWAEATPRPVTASRLEAYVQAKNRRISEVAQHFRVSEPDIARLLEPASRVYRATRGWLKVRE